MAVLIIEILVFPREIIMLEVKIVQLKKIDPKIINDKYSTP